VIGLRVRNASGIVLDITDRLTRVLGTVRTTGPGSLTDPALATGTPWHAEPTRTIVLGHADSGGVSIDGTTVSWTGGGLVFTYGVF
jgi:hypothetical protein